MTLSHEETDLAVASDLAWLVDAHARLLAARHDQAHNGDIVTLGSINECPICQPELQRAAAVTQMRGAPSRSGGMSAAEERLRADVAGHRYDAYRASDVEALLRLLDAARSPVVAQEATSDIGTALSAEEEAGLRASRDFFAGSWYDRQLGRLLATLDAARAVLSECLEIARTAEACCDSEFRIDSIDPPCERCAALDRIASRPQPQRVSRRKDYGSPRRGMPRSTRNDHDRSAAVTGVHPPVGGRG